MAGLFSVTTSRQHELEMRNPALCEELRIRDILDNVAVTSSGAFAAAYELSGLHSHYHTEEMRNRAKESLEAVLRSIPERSMRLHLRYEIRQDTGDVIRRYEDSSRSSNAILASIDAERCSRWSEKETAGRIPRLPAVRHLPLGSRRSSIGTRPRVGTRFAPYIQSVCRQKHPAHTRRTRSLVRGIYITPRGNRNDAGIDRNADSTAR